MDKKTQEEICRLTVEGTVEARAEILKREVRIGTATHKLNQIVNAYCQPHIDPNEQLMATKIHWSPITE